MVQQKCDVDGPMEMRRGWANRNVMWMVQQKCDVDGPMEMQCGWSNGNAR